MSEFRHVTNRTGHDKRKRGEEEGRGGKRRGEERRIGAVPVADEARDKGSEG